MEVYIGIDWSENKHDICFMNGRGVVLQELTIAHAPSGFVEFDSARQALGVEPGGCRIGIESAHNQVVDFLVEHQYEQIYILPPGQVHANRGRYALSGAKDDRRDARLTAEIVRTDHPRLPIWQPDSALIRQMRAQVSLIEFLTREIVRQTNRLRAVLLRYHPAILTVFTELDSPIALALVQTYPDPRQLVQVAYAEFAAFLQAHRHPRKSIWPRCYNRLTRAVPLARAEIIAAYQPEALLLVQLLSTSLQAKQHALQKLHQLYQQHPDQPIFASLPGAGDYLEPALLAKLGDERHRFPSPAVLQAAAGTCPVTLRSGKHRTIQFRQACDHEFRNIVQQWAKASVSQSPWAHAYFQQALRRGSTQNEAYRCLANRWLAILWKLWQTHTPYDEQYHLQQRTRRAAPKS